MLKSLGSLVAEWGVLMFECFDPALKGIIDNNTTLLTPFLPAEQKVSHSEVISLPFLTETTICKEDVDYADALKELEATLNAIVVPTRSSDVTIASSSSQPGNHQAPVKSVTVGTPKITKADIKRMTLCGLGLSYNPVFGNVAAPTLTAEAEHIILGSNKTQQAGSVRCAMTAFTERPLQGHLQFWWYYGHSSSLAPRRLSRRGKRWPPVRGHLGRRGKRASLYAGEPWP